MPEVNKSKQASNGFATEGKSRKAQNMQTGSSLQSTEQHSNAVYHGSTMANRIGTVPAISSATSQSTSIPFRKNGENQEFTDLSQSYKGASHDQIKGTTGGTNSAKARSQTNQRQEVNTKRINYLRQREFANYLRSDPTSADQSQHHPQAALSHQKPRDLNEAFEATFGGEKHAWHGTDD